MWNAAVPELRICDRFRTLCYQRAAQSDGYLEEKETTKMIEIPEGLERLWKDRMLGVFNFRGVDVLGFVHGPVTKRVRHEGEAN
jgi:hypothetical protein